MTGESMDINHLRTWIGRTEMRSDRITPVPAAALAATLDRDDPAPQPGDELPPLWHWLYFLPIHRLSEVGGDGHPKRGGFLPPVPLPRRMWAGGRLQFLRPLRIEEAVTRTSTIVNVTLKEGRTGPLVFVLVRHEIAGPEGPAVVEEQDLVYREHPKPGDPAPAPQAAPERHSFSREVVADEVQLFRYSALTFNGHRIHYDHPYATAVEGYPGIVVHGPLLATLLLDLVRRERPDARVSSFTFRAVRPVFGGQPFSVCGIDEGEPLKLWVKDRTGALAMDATALHTSA